MRSVSNASPTSENRCKAWSGCDVAKARFEAGLASPYVDHPSDHWRSIPVRSFARTREGARDFLRWVDRALAADRPDGEPIPPLHVVCEHTGRYSDELAAWLRAERANVETTLVHPQRASHFTRSLLPATKTDKVEARALTQYGCERRPAGDSPMDPLQAELRELSRARLTLVESRTAEKNRAQEPCDSPLVRQMQNQRIAQYDRDIARIEKKMKRVIRRLPALHRDAQLIETIVGVGEITAIAIVAELGDLRRFARARQLTAFVGLAPRVGDSGASVHRKSHLSKAGEPRIRGLLYMCAMSAAKHNPHMKEVYDRLVADGKEPMVALGAVMRKLIVLMRALVLSATPYRPDHRRGAKPLENPGKTCSKKE